MSETVLNVETREGSGKGAVRKLRVEGKVPAIVYGPNLKPISLSINRKELDDLSRSISLESTIITLHIEGGPKKPINTLVKEVQRHPFKDLIYHLDFMQISMKEVVEVEVPIVLLGIPEGVRTTGGILQHQLREVLISCLPADIPENIEVDVTDLSINESVHVKDLKMKGLDLLSDLDGLVATVLPPTVIKEDVAPEELEEEGLEPELVSKEKEEGAPDEKPSEEAESGKEE